MRSFVVCVLAAAMAAAVGCSSTPTDPVERQREQLKVPPDLVSPQQEAAMQIPALQGGGARGDARDSARPVAPEAIGVRLQREAGVRWLRVDAEPRRVFNWALDYLDRLGIEAARAVPELGLVETEWLYTGRPVTRGVFAPTVKEADAAEVADRYALRVERGGVAGTSSVYLAHRRWQRGEGDWQRAGADPFLEAEFLRGFMLYLGASKAESLRQVRASVGAEGTAELVRGDDGQVALSLQASGEAAWRRVSQALDRAGFSVEQRSQGTGEFVIRYDPQAPVRAEGDADADDEESEVARYRLALERSGSGSRLTVAAADGQPPEAANSEQLLAVILEQLR